MTLKSRSTIVDRHNCEFHSELSLWIIESKGMTTQRGCWLKKNLHFYYSDVCCYVMYMLQYTACSVYLWDLSPCNRTNDDCTSIDRFWFRFYATRWPSNRIPSSSLYIPAEYPVQFLFITLTTIPSILRNVVLSNFQFIPDNIRVVSLWYSEEVCNSPTVSNVRSPPKCGSLCNTINDIGKSRYQQCSWTIEFRFDSRVILDFRVFFLSFFFSVNFTTSRQAESMLRS